MAPKAASAPGGGTWNDALEKEFLLEVIDRGAANAATFGEIAAEWGPPHTKGSLAIKFSRMKAAFQKKKGHDGADKDEAGTPKGGSTPRKGGKDAGTPSKGGKGGRKREKFGEDGGSDDEVKEKKPKVKKNDEDKLEDFADSGAEV